MRYHPRYFPPRHVQKGRTPQDETKVPFHLARNSRLTLREGVLNTGQKTTTQPCIPQITLVFACLKKNNFEEHFCAKEIADFEVCAQESWQFLKEKRIKYATGTYIPGEKLEGKGLNMFLKKFPNL